METFSVDGNSLSGIKWDLSGSSVTMESTSKSESYVILDSSSTLYSLLSWKQIKWIMGTLHFKKNALL